MYSMLFPVLQKVKIYQRKLEKKVKNKVFFKKIYTALVFSIKIFKTSDTLSQDFSNASVFGMKSFQNMRLWTKMSQQRSMFWQISLHRGVIISFSLLFQNAQSSRSFFHQLVKKIITCQVLNWMFHSLSRFEPKKLSSLSFWTGKSPSGRMLSKNFDNISD